MDRYEGIISLPAFTCLEANRILESGVPYDKVPTGGIITWWTTRLPSPWDKMIEADIKVVNGEPPYVDAVLFSDGCEIDVCEPGGAPIEGDYRWHVDGYEFVVTVRRR